MSEAGETIKWNAYLLYVKDWVSAHSSPDCRGFSPLTFQEYLAFKELI